MNLIQKTMIASLIALGVNTSASAATYNVSNNILMGAYDVNVDGTFYDVVFEDGTFASGYNGTFTSHSSAVAASTALLNQVFNNGDIYDTNLAKTNGCSNVSLCYITTLYSKYLDTYIVGNSLYSYSGTTPDMANKGSMTASSTFNTNTSGSHTLAKWTKKGTNTAATAVPEPEVYAMMLAGLGLIGFAAHNKKKSRNRRVLSQG